MRATSTARRNGTSRENVRGARPTDTQNQNKASRPGNAPSWALIWRDTIRQEYGMHRRGTGGQESAPGHSPRPKQTLKRSESDTSDQSYRSKMLKATQMQSFAFLGKGQAFSALSFIPSTGNEYDWDELLKIEKHRRDLLRRVYDPIHRILFYWNGTCLTIVFQEWLFWMSSAIYLLIRVLHGITGLPDWVESWVGEGGGNIGIIGGFLSFFLVFFVVNSVSESGLPRSRLVRAML